MFPFPQPMEQEIEEDDAEKEFLQSADEDSVKGEKPNAIHPIDGRSSLDQAGEREIRQDPQQTRKDPKAFDPSFFFADWEAFLVAEGEKHNQQSK